jgi:hypothetical protein
MDFFAGQEVVSRVGDPIWTMVYAGGILPGRRVDAAAVYGTLREALLRVTPEEPFRGPRHRGEGETVYQSESRGDLERFDGRETIAPGGEIVYELTYSGGLVA